MDEMYKVYTSQEYVDSKIEESRVHPDWNQNDPTAADYVKNRTHWVESGSVDILPEMELPWNGDDEYFYMPNQYNEPLVIGDTYIVTLNGETYKCVAFKDENAKDGIVAIANDDVPFLIHYSAEPYEQNMEGTPLSYGVVDMWPNIPDALTISIKKEVETVHTLDPKYLPAGSGSGGGVQPDWNQNDPNAPDYVKNRTHYKADPSVRTVIERTTSETDGAGWLDVSLQFPLAGGQTYRVEWDGDVYECVAREMENGVVEIGNAGGSTGEPFYMVAFGMEDYGLRANESGTHTVEITTVYTEVKQIENDYLPKATDDTAGVVSFSEIEEYIAFMSAPVAGFRGDPLGEYDYKKLMNTAPPLLEMFDSSYSVSFRPLEYLERYEDDESIVVSGIGIVFDGDNRHNIGKIAFKRCTFTYTGKGPSAVLSNYTIEDI